MIHPGLIDRIEFSRASRRRAGGFVGATIAGQTREPAPEFRGEANLRRDRRGRAPGGAVRGRARERAGGAAATGTPAPSSARSLPRSISTTGTIRRERACSSAIETASVFAFGKSRTTWRPQHRDPRAARLRLSSARLALDPTADCRQGALRRQRVAAIGRARTRLYVTRPARSPRASRSTRSCLPRVRMPPGRARSTTATPFSRMRRCRVR